MFLLEEVVDVGSFISKLGKSMEIPWKNLQIFRCSWENHQTFKSLDVPATCHLQVLSKVPSPSPGSDVSEAHDAGKNGLLA